MTGLGLNGVELNGKDFFNYPGYAGYEKAPYGSHYYESFFDNSRLHKKPLSLMLSGNYFIVKNILAENSYEEVVMTGISGGGWYTTLLSSIIPEINFSISFAGTVPLIFRIENRNLGDWEQYNHSLFEHLDYVDLYALSTLNDKFERTRRHYQVYNANDPCCFDSKAAKVLKKIYDKLNLDLIRIVLLERSTHDIDVDVFERLLGEE